MRSRRGIFERRWPEGKPERLPQLAQDLAALNVDTIVAWSTPAVASAKRASSKIPIVMGSSGDAVATGLVESIAVGLKAIDTRVAGTPPY